MKRRTFVRNMLIAGAGIWLLPSCEGKGAKSNIALKHIKLTAKQEALLKQLAILILPVGDKQHVRTDAHLYAIMMVDECFVEKDRKAFTEGLAAFEKHVGEKYESSAKGLIEKDGNAILTALEANPNSTDSHAAFYKSYKNLIIEAYTTSKYYLTKVQPYKLVPGKFKGTVPVPQKNKA